MPKIPYTPRKECLRGMVVVQARVVMKNVMSFTVRLGGTFLFAMIRMKKSFIVLMTIRHISRLRKRFAQRYEALMLDYLFVSEQLSFLTSTFFILLSSMAECSQL